MIRRGCLPHVAPVIFLIILSCVHIYSSAILRDDIDANIYSNQFAVHIEGGLEATNNIAKKYGFINRGQIGDLDNFYLLEHQHVHKRSTDRDYHRHQSLQDDPEVSWVEQQVELTRVKRYVQDIAKSTLSRWSDILTTWNELSNQGTSSGPKHQGTPVWELGYSDPLYKKQWYLQKGNDGMNIESAWRRGYTGKGVVVSILDDGIQHNHPDLIKNYDPQASTDIVNNDSDPMPPDDIESKHGTRCAGVVASEAFNDFCGVGVAYNANIGGIQMLDGPTYDTVESSAISFNSHHIDIYSSSWGPTDDGKSVDGPGHLTKRALENGITRGRYGKGSIFVWASGNGGRSMDDCNCDGYTNSIYTLSVSSASERGLNPWYAEQCSSILATTYSSGQATLDKSIVTVDLDIQLRKDKLCTEQHTGTSVSAPMAAGVCALVLEANNALTWRDMQHLVVRTARSEPLKKNGGWFINGVGRNVSHAFGYGLMDADAMVALAEGWSTVPPQHKCESSVYTTNQTIPVKAGSSVQSEITTDGCAATDAVIRYLEHVQAKVTLTLRPRGNVNINLISPSGTSSTLLFERPKDNFFWDFKDWPFMSVHFWGEKAAGTWRLIVTNSGGMRVKDPGLLVQWQLILHGTKTDPVSGHRQGGTDSFIPSVPSMVSNYKYDDVPENQSSPKKVGTSLDSDTAVTTPPTNYDNIYMGYCDDSCPGACSGPGPDQCINCPYYSFMGKCVHSCPEGTSPIYDKHICSEYISKYVSALKTFESLVKLFM